MQNFTEVESAQLNATRAVPRLLPTETAAQQPLDPAIALERLIAKSTGGAIHRLRVEIDADGICLTGSCRTFYVKQLAQQAAMRAAPGSNVRNLIDVC